MFRAHPCPSATVMGGRLLTLPAQQTRLSHARERRRRGGVSRRVQCAQSSLEPTASEKLGSFRRLMAGILGGAGVAHLVDLLGPGVLPASIGVPPFADLAPAGKAAALLWCALGPAVTLAYSRTANLLDPDAAKELGKEASLPADNAIRLYFAYEVALDAYCSLSYLPPDEVGSKILQAIAVAASVMVSLQVLTSRAADASTA